MTPTLTLRSGRGGPVEATRPFRLDRAVSVVTLAALAALYLTLLAPQLGRPLVYDDVNFAFAARAVAETGLAFANAGHMSDRWDFSQREQWALWHPPLYIYVLGLDFKLFGVSETSARLLGAAFGLGTGLLVYLTGRALVAGLGVAAEATGLLAAAFFLLSPLATQSALILDIDGTVLTFLLVLITFVVVRFPPRRQPRSRAVLAVLFALALWAKLTTPLGLLAALIVSDFLAGRAREAARTVLVVGLGGGALFLVTWGLASLLLRMPFEMPFAVTWIQLWLAADSTAAWRDSPAAAAQALGPGLLWAGTYLALLFLAAALARGRGYLVSRKAQPVDLLIGFGLLVYGVYLIKLAGGFPKYQVAMLPFWALASAAFVVEVVGRVGPREVGLALAALGAFYAYARSLSDAWVYGLRPEVGSALITAPLLIAGGLAAAYYLAGGRGRSLLLILTAFALAWGPGVVARLGAADFSTTYFYGTRGQREAAAVLDSLVGPDEFYVASKDVAWYTTNQRYVDQETLDYFVQAERGRFDGRLLGYDVRVLALWQRPDALKAHYRQLLEPGHDLVAERGDYAIWVRREQ